MVEEVTARTIAMEAWKESTVHVISASARLDLVCLEGELVLEAVLVIMVSFFLIKSLCSRHINFSSRRWRLRRL